MHLPLTVYEMVFIMIRKPSPMLLVVPLIWMLVALFMPWDFIRAGMLIGGVIVLGHVLFLLIKKKK